MIASDFKMRLKYAQCGIEKAMARGLPPFKAKSPICRYCIWGDWARSGSRPETIGSMKPSLFQCVAVVAALVIALIVSPPTAPAQDSAETKLLALENMWNNAEKAGNAAALSLIFDDAMVYIDADGSLLSKAQFLERTKTGGSQLQTLVTDGISVHVYGESAIVESLRQSAPFDVAYTFTNATQSTGHREAGPRSLEGCPGGYEAGD